MNAPNASTVYQAAPHQPAPTRRPMWFISLMFLGALIAFVLVTGRQEIARWHYAATSNAIQDQQYDNAIESANRGLGWSPEYTELIGLRAMAHLENKQFEECLKDYDLMLELAAKDEAITEADLRPKSAKANVLQRLNRFPESIAVWDELVEYRKNEFRLRDDNESRYNYAMALNNRAYTEAQAWTLEKDSVDIKQSLADIQLAMEVGERMDDPVMLDTLGYLMLLNGDLEDAMYQLEMAVGLTKQENEAIRRRYIAQMQKVVDQRPFQLALERLDQQYSVILHHRGEAHAALGNQEQAGEDIEKAIELGFDPDEGIW